MKKREEITPFISPINQFLDIMGDLSIDAVGKDKYLNIVSDIENEMTYGIVEISSMPGKEVQYIPIGYKKGIPLRLSSAVITELSPLLLILKMKATKREFVINDLMVEYFIEYEDNVISLEEIEDTGRNRLDFKVMEYWKNIITKCQNRPEG